MAHSVEIRKCLTSNSTLRIFVEHWHNELPNPEVAGTMIIRDDTKENTSDIELVVSGVVNEATDRTNLPGCVGESKSELVRSCDIINDDWVYFDFPTVCGVSLKYTFLAGTTKVLEDGE